jgi:Flp pilus assembly protein CpaB
MGKMITAVLAIAAISAAAYYALNHMQANAAAAAGEPSSAKRQLDNVRGAAHRIESDADQRAHDLESKMQDNQ